MRKWSKAESPRSLAASTKMVETPSISKSSKSSNGPSSMPFKTDSTIFSAFSESTLENWTDFFTKNRALTLALPEAVFTIFVFIYL